MPTRQRLRIDNSGVLGDAAEVAKLLDAYLKPAFGSLPKSEIDILVFDALIRTRRLSASSSIYDLSRAMNVTQSRARSLLLKWQMRQDNSADAIKSEIANALKSTRYYRNAVNGKIEFGIDNPFLREELQARLKSIGIFISLSSGEIVSMPPKQFAAMLEMLASNMAAIRKQISREAGLPDKSVFGVITAVTAKLATKVMGELGNDLVGDFSDAVSDFIDGNVGKLIKIATGGD